MLYAGNFGAIAHGALETASLAPLNIEIPYSITAERKACQHLTSTFDLEERPKPVEIFRRRRSFVLERAYKGYLVARPPMFDSVVLGRVHGDRTFVGSKSWPWGAVTS